MTDKLIFNIIVRANQREEEEKKIMVLEKECLLQAAEECLKLEERKTEKDFQLNSIRSN